MSIAQFSFEKFFIWGEGLTSPSLLNMGKEALQGGKTGRNRGEFEKTPRPREKKQPSSVGKFTISDQLLETNLPGMFTLL